MDGTKRLVREDGLKIHKTSLLSRCQVLSHQTANECAKLTRKSNALERGEPSNEPTEVGHSTRVLQAQQVSNRDQVAGRVIPILVFERA